MRQTYELLSGDENGVSFDLVKTNSGYRLVATSSETTADVYGQISSRCMGSEELLKVAAAIVAEILGPEEEAVLLAKVRR